MPWSRTGVRNFANVLLVALVGVGVKSDNGFEVNDYYDDNESFQMGAKCISIHLPTHPHKKKENSPGQVLGVPGK